MVEPTSLARRRLSDDRRAGQDACIIDYGGTTATLADRRRGEVVRTYRRQRAGFDALAEPGETDITVDVNSDVLRRVVEELGGRVAMTDQASFLNSFGADAAMRDLIDRSHALARSGDVMGQLKARSEATDLKALVDPSGFGGFSVFLIRNGPEDARSAEVGKNSARSDGI